MCEKSSEYFKRSFFAVDGLWFMMLEDETSFKKALEIDEKVKIFRYVLLVDLLVVSFKVIEEFIQRDLPVVNNQQHLNLRLPGYTGCQEHHEDGTHQP